ncbi:Hypothetical predicted protein [Lecanosticta acicola]|uniref:Uncharacterized protein n=1 Tax=Lecanosticta acicola TaxID=111012 RepID=A0AAI8YS81_9PEZI|nr:Hypothetical predicted protein [Lecanosticta acicola]
MPHKHTRRREGDEKNFDLAPSQTAKPLPAFEKAVKSGQKGKDGRQKQQQQQQPTSHKAPTNGSKVYRQDDTPREFARLMQYQESGGKRPSGLDDGENRRLKKKRRTEGKADKEDQSGKPSDAVIETAEKLRIMPGERLRDFAARVNQALPVSGLARKGKHVEGAKERQTKTEKRLHKMYAEWREEEARRKEKLEELQEQQEEEDEEQEAALGGQTVQFPNSGRKAKRKRMVGEVDEDDEDPWAVLRSKREAPKGLHDVVQAPPTMKVVPKEKFKVSNGARINVANVPGASGSLKRREELGEARKEVIDRLPASNPSIKMYSENVLEKRIGHPITGMCVLQRIGHPITGMCTIQRIGHPITGMCTIQRIGHPITGMCTVQKTIGHPITGMCSAQ